VDFIQQLRARGILPGLGGAIKVIESVGSATPRIPRPIAPVPVGRPFNPLNPIVGPRGTSPVPNPKVISNVGRFARGSIPSLVAEGALMLGDRFIPGGVPSEVRGAVQGTTLGYMLGGPAGAALGLLGGADLSNERGRGAGSLTGEFERGNLKLDPLEARRLYMQQVPGSERSMDMDAPVPDLTGDAIYDGEKYVYSPSSIAPVAPVAPVVPRVSEKELRRQSVRSDYDKILADKNLSDAEKQAAGLEMWRRENPELAERLDEKTFGERVPGKAGYNPLMQETFGYQSEPAVRQPLEGEEIINAVNANKEAELRERFTAPEGADQPKFVIEEVLQPAAKDEKSARAKLLQRALTRRILDDQDFPADAPKILN